MKKALVIGGGFGGMAAALRLRAKHYEVTLVEKNAALGGRGQVYVRNGYTHDAGPTVITAPFLFEELFALFGEQFSDHVRLVPLKPWYRFHFHDRSTFDYGGSVEDTLAEIEKISPEDKAGYLKLVAHSKAIYDVAFTKLSAVPFHQVLRMFAVIPQLIWLRSYETVWQMVCRHLKHPKLRQAFSIQPLLVGGNPFSTTSIYGLIHYLERAFGVFFAMGGTGAIVKALEALMRRQHIHIKTQTTVTKVIVQQHTATAVHLDDGSVMDVDLIVSNADPTHLYQCMVDAQDLAIETKLKLRVANYSMGLFVVYFGTTRTYPEVAHHTIWLGKSYQTLLKQIFDDQQLSDDFSLYVHRPTATDPSFAPAGCDSFYVLCPVPNLQGTCDWQVEGPTLKQKIIEALDQTMLPELKNHMVEDFFVSPVDFQSQYLSTHGAGFSISPLFRQSAWFRFHNQSESIKNLYLVGAGTHPGAGLPGVLCSAKVLDAMQPDGNRA